MPLTTDNIIQGYATPSVGSFNATSGSATLPSATTAGNTIVVVVGSSGGLDVAMSGFTRATGADPSGSRRGGVFTKPADGASSWTITVSSAQPTVWAAYEVEGVDADFPVDVTTTWASGGPGVAANTPETPTSTTYDGLVLGVFFGANLSGTTVPVWSNLNEKLGSNATGDYLVLSESSRVEASTAFGMAVVFKTAQQIGIYGAFANVSPTSSYGVGCVILTATGAKRSSRIDAMCGFEIGTTAGWTTGVTGYPPFDVATGTPEVVTAHPRTGVYGLKLSSAAAIENVAWTSPGVLDAHAPPSGGPNYPVVKKLHFFFETSLPGTDVPLYSIECGSLANGMVLWYRTASQKFAIKVGSGTEIACDAVVAADTHIGVDLRYDPRTTVHRCDWAVDYDSLDATPPVAQAQASNTGMTATKATTVRFGWHDARTCTVFIDDVALSKVGGHYPLGDIRIYPLKVDPASAVVVYASGSPDPGAEVNFQTFTANGGTLTAWNATTARGAIDDIPPAIGASADGIAQITANAAVMRISMETYNGAGAEVGRAVKWYFCGWAGAATANNVLVRALTPSAILYTLFAIGDPGFDNSTTTPGWICRMHRGGLASEADDGFVWTQAELDGLICEIGGSTDATPDVGIHAVLAEVCMRAVESMPVFGQPGGLPRVEQDVDPDSGGIAALRVYTDTGQSAVLTWYNAAGTPTPVAIAAGSNPQTILLNAADVPTTPRLEFVIDE